MSDVLIDRDIGEVKIILDTKFYGYGSILQAGKDFSESCWVYVDGDIKDKMLVTIKPKTQDIRLDTVGYEFSNYVLGLMQNAIF
jgi:hypothetical protein